MAITQATKNKKISSLPLVEVTVLNEISKYIEAWMAWTSKTVWVISKVLHKFDNNKCKT